jgi:hypothetical protein
MSSAFVVHIDTEGQFDLLAFGSSDTRFLVIDERAPHDRVYRITLRQPRALLAELLGDSPIGDCSDDRHPALAARFAAAVEGRPLLKAVPTDG